MPTPGFHDSLGRTDGLVERRDDLAGEQLQMVEPPIAIVPVMGGQDERAERADPFAQLQQLAGDMFRIAGDDHLVQELTLPRPQSWDSQFDTNRPDVPGLTLAP
jgi:hypothetical protein